MASRLSLLARDEENGHLGDVELGRPALFDALLELRNRVSSKLSHKVLD